ncbi:hypothetical protein K435DRAFT_850767 [Dendrothele bispora CBS 962.96]|uniref:Uncharacterized protein n=1 Tax=Dendrothele bispora (strain CBS 962.96) TaxID=1314807 RepID=A0A4S8MP11_DENBC|nr:hypothetical protein K435DRAFT_850767 [Dendrothele bispora CBS 962.96]
MEELRPSTAVTSRPTERSKDTRTEKQKEDHLPWAERVCAMFPDYQTPRNSVSKLASPKEDKINAKLDAIQTQLDNIAKIGTTTRPAFTSESEPFASVLHSQDSLSDSLSTVPIVPMQSSHPQSSHLPSSHLLSSHLPSSTLPSLSSPSLSSPLSSSPLPSSLSSSPLPSSLSSSPLPSSLSSSFVRSFPPSSLAVTQAAERKSRHLTLKTGIVIHYDTEDLPDPPYLSFHNDIPRLGRLWDESHPGFSQEPCHVQVNGVRVPLRLWDQIHTYTGGKTWTGIKGTWSNWKFVAEYYNQTTPEKFWTEFYDTKKKRRMTWTAIVEVAAARETMGTDFDLEYHDSPISF